MKTTNNTRKATHSGTCQLCGREQKLPGGRLSLHGYTTRWGFFSGVCPGSTWLPFEVSADRIAIAIEANGQYIARLEVKEAEALANPGPEVMRRDYNQKGKPFVKKTLKLDGTRTALHMQYSVMTDAELVGKFNKEYAASFRNLITQVTEHTEWLRERLASWKPGTLKEVGPRPSPPGAGKFPT